MAELPTSPVKRILLANGVQRISPSAVGIAIHAAEEFLGRLGREAAKEADAAKRKTVQDSDVEAARRTLGYAGTAPAPAGGETKPPSM